jgi:hypothetical protein
MSRIPRSQILIFFLVFLCLGFSCRVFAASAPGGELEEILRKIEDRHYRWIAIRADVLLFFATAEGSRAMCGGELLYQRLDERLFLACVDSQNELVFAFRTLDRRFDLYLPAQNTVYHGSIFDLEDSPEIESHLKARDLYRALKPMAVDPRRTKIERTNAIVTSLDVYGKKDGEETPTRKLYLTPEGDVRGEIFYDPKGRPVTEIRRYDFKKLTDRGGSFGPVTFPKKITIASPKTKKESAIFFTRVDVLDAIDPLEFILRVPYGTKEIFLDEKDPRFATRQFKRDGKPSKTKTLAEASPRTKVLPAAVIPEKETHSFSQKEEFEKDADIFLESRPETAPLSDSEDPDSLDPSLDPSAA